MSISATKFTFAYLWLFVTLLRLGGAQDVSDNSVQGSLLPTPIEKQTSTAIPAYSRLRRASSSCLTPAQPVNGKYKLNRYFCDNIADCEVSEGIALKPGSQLVYRCSPGYRATADTDVYCSVRGEWSAIPECIQVRCNSLNSESTMVSCTRFGRRVNCDSPVPPQTRAKVTCRHGYQKDTDFVSTRRATVDCNTDGKWEPQPVRCIPVCGRTITQQQPLIFGGTPAKIGDFPWHVSLFLERRSITGNRKRFRCGGTIIRTNLVLTAAHCVYDEITKTTEDPSKLFVITGNVLRDYDSPEHNPAIVRKASVKNVYTTCNYYGLIGNYISDIALLELQQPFEFSSILLPACLDDSGKTEQILEPGVHGRIAGFGRTDTGATSRVLQTITLPYVSYGQCKSSNDGVRNEAFISSDKFCAGYNNGSAVCEGDSGGGLVFKKGDLWYVMGIVSVGLGVDLDNGEKTCDKYSYSLYTKVSNYITWIQDVLFDLERKQPYPPCNPDSQTTIPSIAPNVTASDVALVYCSAPPQPTNGQWVLAPNYCEGLADCSLPESTAVEEGSQLVYSCAPKFTAEGPTDVFCRHDGEWTSIPICIDGPCSLTDGSSGVCTLVKNCQTISKETEVRMTSDDVCGSSELEPIVCCPLASNVVNTTSPPVDMTSPPVEPEAVVGNGRGAIANRKCIDYSQYANPGSCPWSLVDDEQQEYTSSTSTGRLWPERLEFPHAAAIGFLFQNTTQIWWACGGALISEVFVVTQAACINSKSSGNATMVRVGELNAINDDTYEERRIIEIIIHPEFKPPSEYHDIGLLRLESPISFDGGIRPACLHTQPSVETRGALTTKWGYRIEEIDEASTSLFKVPLPLVDLPICKARWASVIPEPVAKRITGSNILRFPTPQRMLAQGIVEDWLICAGATGKGVCQSEPGGALVIHRNGKGKKLCMYDVIGVTSIGRTCSARIPTLYTRIYHYVPWIESIVWGQG